MQLLWQSPTGGLKQKHMRANVAGIICALNLYRSITLKKYQPAQVLQSDNAPSTWQTLILCFPITLVLHVEHSQSMWYKFESIEGVSDPVLKQGRKSTSNMKCSRTHVQERTSELCHNCRQYVCSSLSASSMPCVLLKYIMTLTCHTFPSRLPHWCCHKLFPHPLLQLRIQGS